MKKAILALCLIATGINGLHAFVLDPDGSGDVRRWNLLSPGYAHTNAINPSTKAIRYYLASDGYSVSNATTELNLLRAAFVQWQAISNTHVKFEDAGLVGIQSDINLSDNTNVVYWSRSLFVNNGNDSMAGVLAFTYTSSTVPGNQIVGADIVFNGVSYNWISDFFSTSTANGIAYIEGVAMHEIGHLLGLNHSPVGGATMLFAGTPGVNAQTGLSQDEIAAARYLYPSNLTTFGAIKGTVTKDGFPLLGGAVYAHDSVSNLIVGTVSYTDGTYHLGPLSPGSYQVRVAPLHPLGGTRLVTGADIDGADGIYPGADTTFLITSNVSVSVTAQATNTVNFAVSNGTPPFRITRILAPSPNTSFSVVSSPVRMRVGQSNYFIGVGSTNLPTGGASLTISGDGLTLGAPTFFTSPPGSSNHYIYASISVSSNATPGLRTFSVTQGGTNVAIAQGFLDILPASFDYNFDGLDDAFQRIYFSPFTRAEGAPNADPDGDTMNNLSEYIAATIPTNAASLLRMQTVAVTAGGANVRWQSVTNKRYQVQFRTNLAAGAWSNLGSTVNGSNTVTQVLDPAGTTASNPRFYRVQAIP